MRLKKSRIRWLLSCLVVVVVVPLLQAGDAAVKMTILRLPSGLRFGLIGERPAHPAPTLFVLQSSLETALKEPVYTEVARLMERHGFISIMLDAPAHGEDHRPGEPEEIEGWRWRLDHNEDFIGDFTTKARAVLDYLIKEKYSDPAQVAACGTSRGGFLAFHLAAVEPRIRFVGGIGAVTSLTALREFTTTDHRVQAEALGLVKLVPRLTGRPVWICIGNNDTRVSTDEAFAFTRAMAKAGAVGRKPNEGVPIELIVNATAGHSSTVHDHELLAAWLTKQFGLVP